MLLLIGALLISLTRLGMGQPDTLHGCGEDCPVCRVCSLDQVLVRSCAPNNAGFCCGCEGSPKRCLLCPTRGQCNLQLYDCSGLVPTAASIDEDVVLRPGEGRAWRVPSEVPYEYEVQATSVDAQWRAYVVPNASQAQLAINGSSAHVIFSFSRACSDELPVSLDASRLCQETFSDAHFVLLNPASSTGYYHLWLGNRLAPSFWRSWLGICILAGSAGAIVIIVVVVFLLLWRRCRTGQRQGQSRSTNADESELVAPPSSRTLPL